MYDAYIKNFITVWVMFTGRQTRWDILTWDNLTWDVLTGTFWLGTFDSGTFWLGTFWLWDVLTWDNLTLGHFDHCVHKKSLYIVKMYLGRFDSPKMGRFGKSLGMFWFWDVLTGYRGKDSLLYAGSAMIKCILITYFVYLFVTAPNMHQSFMEE